MKVHFKHSVIPAIALAFAATSPAQAQLLGGGGGLTGGLGGGLTGSIERTTGSVTGSSTGSLRGEKQIDRKQGRVRGSGSATSSSNGSVTGGTTVLNRSLDSTQTGSANASKNGSVDAKLVGTDFVRSTAQGTVARGRGVVGNARGLGNSATGSASGAGSLAGSGNGVFEGSIGQLAASGSAAANATGMFAVEPGMAIEDARGRTIGYVQQVRQTKKGVIEAITVEVGNRTATLPAANFAGSGEALVTGMTRSEMTSAAKEQEAAPANQTTAPATSEDEPITQPRRAAASGRSDGNRNTTKER